MVLGIIWNASSKAINVSSEECVDKAEGMLRLLNKENEDEDRKKQINSERETGEKLH